MTNDQWQWIEKTQQGEQQGKFIELTIPLKIKKCRSL
jgi:hypothetical protein